MNEEHATPDPDADPPELPTSAEEPDDSAEVDDAHKLVDRIGRTRRPNSPKGIYMVLWTTPDDVEAGYVEAGYYKAHGPDHAKRLAAKDAKAGHLPELQEAIAGKGALIRPVPAASWGKIKPTRYSRPEPRLEIG